MQYSEEQYTELYSNLPKNLKEFVLSGQLTIYANSFGNKYDLEEDQVEDLELVIEDVCLGISQLDELERNLQFGVRLDDDKLSKIYKEINDRILEEYKDELLLARKYKIELDEKIREEKRKTSVNPDVVAPFSRAENIIKATEKVEEAGSDILRSAGAKDRTEDKVAGWYNEAKKTLAGIGEPEKPKIEESKIHKNDIFDNLGEKPIKKENQIVETKIPIKRVVDQKSNSNWESVLSDDSPKPNKSTPADHPLTKVEQTLWDLAEEVKSLRQKEIVTPTTPSDSAVYDELSRKVDDLTRKLADMEKKYTEASKTILDLQSIKPKEAPVKTEQEKEELDIKTTTISSSVSASTLDSILDKNFTTFKGVGTNVIPVKPSSIKEDIFSKKEIPKQENNTNILNKPKRNLSDVLLSDLKSIEIDSALPKNNTDEQLSLTIEKKESSVGKKLSEEIGVVDSESKIKSLQNKIKALNKGITVSAVASSNPTDADPYKI